MSVYRRDLWVFLMVVTFAVFVAALRGRATEASGFGAGSGDTRFQGKAQSADAALRALLASQAADWNRGDIDAFMHGYWNSPETTFAGASGISRGWQTVLDHYHKNYPDRATMGHLDFGEIEITPLGNDAALILGRWHLTRDAGPVGGIFTLVARRFPEGWRIIHDHTSSDAAK
jgi:L-asparaginase / beta-aspartyl-peptidase